MRKSIIFAVFAAALAATPLMAQQRPDIRLQDNAPDRYVVVPGDTLWSIAGKFLKDPWRWPEMWKLNRDEIKNPHWIYPGDVIVLERSKPGLELSMGDTVRLSPRVRSEDVGKAAIPSIPLGVVIAPQPMWDRRHVKPVPGPRRDARGAAPGSTGT